MSESTTNTYWKSLNELSQNKEYEKFLHREFPENASELEDGVSRRGFLKVMGASIALAGFAACRRPVQKILPYAKQPEDIVPGIPLYYATAMPFQGNLTGLVVENHEGRPTKIEGNELHPASGGGTGAFQQASILGMYDQDRSRKPLEDGTPSTRDTFAAFARFHFSETNRKVVFISEANSSPTFQALKERALNRLPNATWATFEPFGENNALEGNNIAFGQRLRTYLNIENADVVVSLNDDFLSGTHPNGLDYSRQVGNRRRVTSTSDSLNRIYMVEDSFSVTGSAADNRLRLKASEIEGFTYALAAELSSKVSGLGAFSGYSGTFTGHKWVTAVAEDLVANQGKGIVTVGIGHHAHVHAAVAAINLALGNAGETVTYLDVPHLDDVDNNEAFANAIGSIDNETTVVIIGTNPVLTAPANLNVGGALDTAEAVLHLSDYLDETSQKAKWHVNRAHYLEAWGDGYSYTGARSIIQPQIEPLFDGVSEIEFLAAIAFGRPLKGYDLVQNTWKRVYTNGFEKKWRKVLHDGVDDNSLYATPRTRLARNFSSTMSGALSNASAISGIEVVIRPDASLYDGRFANNGWLQEMPDPMTKITWDNVALMSPATAASLGVDNEENVQVTVNGASVTLAAWIQPGHVDNSITLNAGYGRTGIGAVADFDKTGGGGFNVYPLRSLDNLLYGSGTVAKASGTYAISCVQDHHSLEGRDMYRETTLADYKTNPDFASFKSAHTYELPGLKEGQELGEDVAISLFDEQTFPDREPQWGMAIDLNTCFGCGVCLIACQSENNIPVIGKREVGRGREMSWIRNDRYFVADNKDATLEEIANSDNLRAVHQPVPCMQCEAAPCEQVCPVAATTHSDDGVNQMTYNRCIGTRYCANNCPYKVRRFNFFNYPKEYLTTGDDPEIIQMAMNPEVTVRFRGVMEKCTYCVQRVNRAKIEAKIETGSPKPADGTVKTACQQACAAGAIYFGDLTDKNSEVSKMKQNERNYLMLEELNTRPRTSYLGKLRNPNPALA